jgi:hypothetical protein
MKPSKEAVERAAKALEKAFSGTEGKLQITPAAFRGLARLSIEAAMERKGESLEVWTNDGGKVLHGPYGLIPLEPESGQVAGPKPGA